MASFFSSFSSPLEVDIRLEGEEDRQQIEVKAGEKDRKEKCPVYYDGESVRGQVSQYISCLRSVFRWADDSGAFLGCDSS